MILTPNGEMKIFADGVQVFQFLDGRWRLTDAQRKYDLWKEAIRDSELAERLFTTALNLAEDRRGGLLVVLDDPEMAASLVSRTDLLTSRPNHRQHAGAGAKGPISLLVAPEAHHGPPERRAGDCGQDRRRNRSGFPIEPARIRRAILQHPDLTDVFPESIEGGRTTAVISASRFGNVLKISEDGLISFFQNGRCIWTYRREALMISSAAVDLRLPYISTPVLHLGDVISFFARIPTALCRHLLFSHVHDIVLAFPAIFVEPQESELNGIPLILGQRNIHELNSNRCSL
jgi:hypothetical protein